MTNDTLTIEINKVQKSKINQVDWDNLPFGKVFSDHMLEMNYGNEKWGTPVIKPFEDLQLHPATSAIHYGQSVFEGIKATKDADGNIIIFRPDLNAIRFAESCERMCMPIIETDDLIEMIRRTVEADRNWVPAKEGYSLYIRPFMFATDQFIGIKPSENYKFIIFTCPVGAYYTKPVKVKIEEKYTRAAQGGVGAAKTAGNYGASLYPAKLAQEQGFDQLVWTDASEHKYIEESGTMNILFEIDGKLVTPSEDVDTILHGVTKRSALEIAKHWGVEVEERKITVQEIVEGIKNGSVTDAFGAGTAATIAQIASVGFRNEMLELPPVESRGISNKIKNYLNDLKAGKLEDEMNWLYKF